MIAVGTKARARGLRDRAQGVQHAPMPAAGRGVPLPPVGSGAPSVVVRAAIAPNAGIAPPSAAGPTGVIAPSVLLIGIGGAPSVALMVPAAAAVSAPVLSAPVRTVRAATVLASKAPAAVAAAVSAAPAAPRPVRVVSPRRAPHSKSAALSVGLCGEIAIRRPPAAR